MSLLVEPLPLTRERIPLGGELYRIDRDRFLHLAAAERRPLEGWLPEHAVPER